MADGGTTRRRYLAASATSGFTLAGLSGCLGGIGDSEVLKWGLVIPFSGPYVADGERTLNGAEMAIEEHNEDGGFGGEDIEVYTADSETDPSVATTAAERLVREEDIDVIASTTGGSVGVAIADFAQRNEILAITGASTAELTTSSCNRYTFNIGGRVDTMGNATLPWFDENGGYDSVFFISADFSWGETAWEAYQEILADRSLEIAGNTFSPFGESDYSTYIQQARESGADLVCLTLWGEDLIQCVDQMRDVGATDEFDVCTMYTSLTNAHSMDDVTGIYGGGPYYWRYDTQENQEFVERYENKYGEKPTIVSGGEYNVTNEVLTIARDIGSSDAADIASELEGHEFTDFKGEPARFRECDHQLTSDWFVLRGKPSDERESEDDLYEILETRPADEITGECSDECDLPAW